MEASCISHRMRFSRTTIYMLQETIISIRNVQETSTHSGDQFEYQLTCYKKLTWTRNHPRDRTYSDDRLEYLFPEYLLTNHHENVYTYNKQVERIFLFFLRISRLGESGGHEVLTCCQNNFQPLVYVSHIFFPHD